MSSHTARRAVAVGLLMFNGARERVASTMSPSRVTFIYGRRVWIYAAAAWTANCACASPTPPCHVTSFPPTTTYNMASPASRDPLAGWRPSRSCTTTGRRPPATWYVHTRALPAIEMFHRCRKSVAWHSGRIRYDTRCCFNVRSKADMSRLNLQHGDDK